MRWDFWQFTDGVHGEAQIIPGVKGPVDCERFRGELAELQQLAPLSPLGLTHTLLCLDDEVLSAGG